MTILIYFIIKVVFWSCVLDLSHTLSLPFFNQKDASGIYIHIPFCRRHCFYCDFPIEVVGENKIVQQKSSLNYLGLIKKEISKTLEFIKTKNNLNCNMIIDSIYFGGGTPSLMPDEYLNDLIRYITNNFNVSPQTEITLEMDPGTFNKERLYSLKSIGVNRISVGIQSFSEDLLKTCGRAHSLKESLLALEALNSGPIPNFNLDLISSLPLSTMDSWENSLKQAIQFNPHHISIYDLQIEEKTAFGKWNSLGKLTLPSEKLSVNMFRKAQEYLTSEGFDHYEISNYAKPGFRSKHNQKYWKGTSFFGFGQGAASFLNGTRYSRPKSLSSYSSWVDHEQMENIFYSNEPQSHFDEFEYLMLALRTSDGINLNNFQNLFGPQRLQVLLTAIKPWLEDNRISQQENTIRLSDPDGFLISNDIISSILVDLVN